MTPQPAASMDTSDSPARICVGAIGGAHGVRGVVRLKSFTADPLSIGSYGPLWDVSGSRSFVLDHLSLRKAPWVLATVEGIRDRDAAEGLKGTALYVDRAVLPELAEEEYYYTDLLNLPVTNLAGQERGVIRAVQDHGAGTFLEVRGQEKNTSFTIPFTKEAVPGVSVAQKRVVIDDAFAIWSELSKKTEEEAEEKAS